MYSSLAEVQSALAAGNTTIESITQHYLAKIEDRKSLNAFLEVFTEDAIAQAKLADEKRKNGKAGKLSGMVIGIKDNLCYKGHQVSASSKILEGFESIYTATVVERLIAEDAVIIGRLNCDEFAMGSSNENSAFGVVKNPLNEKLVPGGSSGGSAVAVAAGLCLAALGTDTGGSIRQPASFCGVVGLKPTYGRVSRWGCIAYASSFDQIGPLANNVADCAIILEVMAGPDQYDATLSQREVPEFSKELVVSGKKKIAYFKEYIDNDGLDPEIKSKIKSLIEELKAEGHDLTELTFPYLDYVIPAYYILTTAEASSNLSRYDGIHYGYRSKKATDLESTYKLSRSEGFGKEVQRRIMLGTFVLSSGYYDAYYSKAQKVRRMLRDETNEILSNHDFILLPSTPGTAFPIGEKSNDPIKMYLEDIYTVQSNLCGIPAISIPLGKHSNGLPFGVQLMTKSFHESELLGFAAAMMANSDVQTA
ncbi:MAG: Asp-tRNA(Asn)/Glu-tRNA(Gln) amidotransferase subunit GatA [Bacteroidia bacterium]